MLIRAGFEPFRASGIAVRPKLPKSGAITNGVGTSLGEAIPTARLKTGAGKSVEDDRLAPILGRAELCRPTMSPCRSYRSLRLKLRIPILF